jgi:CRISPR/Cas system-associated exonuclease Cas4 (RecB family)
MQANPSMPRPLKHISPSQFISMKECKLRAVWAANNAPRNLPIYPSSRLGIIIHKMIETAGNRNLDEPELEEIWDICVRDQEEQMKKTWFEKHLVPLSSSALDFNLKKSQCFMLLKSRPCVKGEWNQEYVKSCHEIWLRSKDGFVVGRADAIRYEQGGAAILDYKTGNVAGQSFDEKLLSGYEEQLKTYAALFYEEYEEWPRSLMIMGLDGKCRHIAYTEDESKALLGELKDMLTQINQTILHNHATAPKDAFSELASPSKVNCRFCLYRPSCEPYFLKRQNNREDGWPNDIWGTLLEKKVLKNGLGKILLAELCNGNQIGIRSLHLDRHVSLALSTQISAFSLYIDDSPCLFKEGPFTTFYGIDLK